MLECNQVYGYLWCSEIDGKSSEIFRNRIINHSHLYFIVVDSNDNVFGHYHNSVIDKIGGYIKDDKSFMFTLNSNGRCGVMKFNIKHDRAQYATSLCSENSFYYNIGYGHDGDFWIGSFDENGSVLKNISITYEGITNTLLTGKDCSNGIYLTTKRLIVIEMN